MQTKYLKPFSVLGLFISIGLHLHSFVGESSFFFLFLMQFWAIVAMCLAWTHEEKILGPRGLFASNWGRYKKFLQYCQERQASILRGLWVYFIVQFVYSFWTMVFHKQDDLQSGQLVMSSAWIFIFFLVYAVCCVAEGRK